MKKCDKLNLLIYTINNLVKLSSKIYHILCLKKNNMYLKT